MLIVETIAKIRRDYHVQHKGLKTIARERGLSRNTVRKVIRSDRRFRGSGRSSRSWTRCCPRTGAVPAGNG
jgi:hypothetical protein